MVQNVISTLILTNMQRSSGANTGEKISEEPPGVFSIQLTLWDSLKYRSISFYRIESGCVRKKTLKLTLACVIKSWEMSFLKTSVQQNKGTKKHRKWYAIKVGSCGYEYARRPSSVFRQRRTFLRKVSNSPKYRQGNSCVLCVWYSLDMLLFNLVQFWFKKRPFCP